MTNKPHQLRPSLKLSFYQALRIFRSLWNKHPCTLVSCLRLSPSQVCMVKSKKVKWNLASGLSLKSHGPLQPHPPPTLKAGRRPLTRKLREYKRHRMTPSTCYGQTNLGGQQEGKHEVVHDVQGEHFQRKVLRV